MSRKNLVQQINAAEKAWEKAGAKVSKLVGELFPVGSQVEIQWGRGYATCTVSSISDSAYRPGEIFVHPLNETTRGRGHWVCLSRIKGFKS